MMSDRARLECVDVDGLPGMDKTFTIGSRSSALVAELLAAEVFSCFPWFPRWFEARDDGFVMERYLASSRLDVVARVLDPRQRLSIATDAVSIILDIIASGYAHRDFHAGNMFLVGSQLKVIDYETIGEYPPWHRPGLSCCYDVTGEGLDSPWYTDRMNYSHPHPLSLRNTLGVHFTDARNALIERLMIEMQDASREFSRSNGTHVCSSGRIYQSFSLPWMHVPPWAAQRNCARRHERFRSGEMLAGKSILDLGCHCGGMLFEAQKFKPSYCTGIEYDPDKVHCARRVAHFCDLSGVRFERGDVMEMTDIEPHDVVMCLALEAHVKDSARLYRLLAELTGETLLFEGNSSTDAVRAVAELESNGFSRVEYVGMCDDDCIPENNCRPMLRAWK